MKYQGVFFDFDYTLGDSTVPILLGYQKGFRALGQPIPTLEQVRPTIGMTLMDGYTYLTGDQDPAHGQEFYHQFQLAVGELADEEGTRVMIEESKLLPGAAALLTALKLRGADVAIVSTKLSVTIWQIFRFNHLDHLLDKVVGGKDVARYKPDPEGLDLAMGELGLDRSQVLFCGDTVIDAQAAQNAGVDFCAVLNGTTPWAAFEDYPHVHIANDLMEVKTWLGV
jgi:phosphoglycolate phosphatase